MKSHRRLKPAARTGRRKWYRALEKKQWNRGHVKREHTYGKWMNF